MNALVPALVGALLVLHPLLAATSPQVPIAPTPRIRGAEHPLIRLPVTPIGHPVESIYYKEAIPQTRQVPFRNLIEGSIQGVWIHQDGRPEPIEALQQRWIPA